jgi:hypothetical protein
MNKGKGITADHKLRTIHPVKGIIKDILKLKLNLMFYSL